MAETTIHDSNEYNQGTYQKQLFHEEVNSAANWHTIVEAYNSGRARDISDEPKVDNIPCFIIGSGPSLDDSIQYLKEWKGGIICSTSQALTLIYYGIEPTHILALDPFCMYEEIKGIDWSKTRTKLIAHPSVYPDLITKWPNEMLFYIQNNGRKDSFYANTQKRMYTHREGDLRNPNFHFYIRTEMMIFACSPPMQLFAANKLGYGNIFLAGLDFGYHKDKTRFTNYTVSEAAKTLMTHNSGDVTVEPIWEKHVYDYIHNENIRISDNGLPTEEVHFYYKKNFLSSWRLSGATVYSTDHGIATEIPYSDIKKVIRKQGYDFPKQSKQFIAKTVEKYLALVGTWVVETSDGIGFVESKDYKKELLVFMQNINNTYVCSKCGTYVISKDNNDHENENCPNVNCKEGKLLHTNKIDIDFNMKKFEKYYNLTHEPKVERIRPTIKVPNEVIENKLKEEGII